MQTASSRNWTWVAMSIFNDNNYYTMGTSLTVATLGLRFFRLSSKSYSLKSILKQWKFFDFGWTPHPYLSSCELWIELPYFFSFVLFSCFKVFKWILLIFCSYWCYTKKRNNIINNLGPMKISPKKQNLSYNISQMYRFQILKI